MRVDADERGQDRENVMAVGEPVIVESGGQETMVNVCNWRRSFWG